MEENKNNKKINIIYRVMRKRLPEEQKEGGWSSWSSDNEIVAQDVMQVSSREDFRSAITAIYGDDIKFKNAPSIKPGDLFISIISYECYDADDYLNTALLTCESCGEEFLTNKRYLQRLTPGQLHNLCATNDVLFRKESQHLLTAHFCCPKCRDEFYQDTLARFADDALATCYHTNDWIARENFSDNNGYIYMITKKSTKEFYVGQTNALPIFRWAQHLKTSRFPVDKIMDYRFEVLEIVRTNNLRDREAYWINTKYSEAPEKCLNVQIPSLS